jgi:hypothetical protein
MAVFVPSASCTFAPAFHVLYYMAMLVLLPCYMTVCCGNVYRMGMLFVAIDPALRLTILLATSGKAGGGGML